MKVKKIVYENIIHPYSFKHIFIFSIALTYDGWMGFDYGNEGRIRV
jgi:hypothetical protein